MPILLQTFWRAGLSLLRGAQGGPPLSALDALAGLVIEGTLQAVFIITFIREHPKWFRWLDSSSEMA